MDLNTTQKRRLFTVSSLVCAAILFFAINIISQTLFFNSRLDLTSNHLYTLSQGTHDILHKMNEPVTLHLYYSKKAGQGLAGISSYALRVEELLKQYERLSNGHIQLKITDPQPFSEEEDRAMAYGLQGAPLDDNGSTFYFGLVGTNSTDGQQIIPFFQLNRETFLEYDVTKLIYQLIHPQQPTIGVLTAFPMNGNPANSFMPQQRSTAPWGVWSQMSEFFTLEMLPTPLASVPKAVDVLLVAGLPNVDDQTLYAIDQFVVGGGNLLWFVDTYTASPYAPEVTAANIAKINRLLTTWGVKLRPNQVAADRTLAKHVWYQRNSRQVMGPYPLWMNLTPKYMDAHDLITGTLHTVTLAAPGILDIVDGAKNTIVPLIHSSTDAQVMNTGTLSEKAGDPDQLLADYKPGNQSLNYAMRITGRVQSAYKKAPEIKTSDKQTPQADAASSVQEAHLTQADKPVNIVIVTDSDMLQDKFWLRVQNFLGRPIATPIADNGNLLVNALDNLTGSSALISVRSRGEYTRPFNKLIEIQQQAQNQYQKNQNALLAKLEETEQRLRALNDHKIQGNQLILSEAQRQEIEKFRNDQIAIRKELRHVQHALQEDIEKLQNRIKLIDIALMPTLIGIGGITLAGYRSRRRRRLTKKFKDSNS